MNPHRQRSPATLCCGASSHISQNRERLLLYKLYQGDEVFLMKNSFAAVHPELVDEWSERNAPLTADDITYGSNKVVWWHGKCGHEWETSVKARSSGEKCPICDGIRIVEEINDLATTHPLIAAEWSPQNLPFLPTMVGAGSHKKVWWRDKLGHEWKAEVRARVKGTGCPYCSHNKVLEGFNDLATRFPEVAAEWSERNLPLLPTMVTAFANRKVWWKCSKGHEWYTLISTRAGGSKCPYCSGIELLKGFNDFATRQPELAEEWSDRNLPLTPDMVNEKSRKKVWWKCRVCGFEWQSLVKSRIKGTVCPVCADRAVKDGYNDLATTDPEIAAEWSFERNKGLLPQHISRNSLRFVWWKDQFGHEWRDRVFNRAVEGTGCKVCEEEFRNAYPQLLISLYARKLGVDVIYGSEKLTGTIIENYIPELRLAIETSERLKEATKVKGYICEKQRIQYIWIPLKRKDSLAGFAQRVKMALQKAHVYISSDEEQDVELLHRLFGDWRQSAETT